jgi:hypothetical protein
MVRKYKLVILNLVGVTIGITALFLKLCLHLQYVLIDIVALPIQLGIALYTIVVIDKYYRSKLK